MNKPQVSLIFASSLNNVIGHKNKLPWGNLEQDLQRFKSLTDGGVVIMGRNTYYSLPKHVRPLSNRVNIVLSSVPLDEDIHVARTIKDSLDLAISIHTETPVTGIWFIGGSSVLKDGLPYADRIYKTLVFREFFGDTYAPTIPNQEWEEVYRSTNFTSHNHDFCFINYHRIKNE